MSVRISITVAMHHRFTCPNVSMQLETTLFMHRFVTAFVYGRLGTLLRSLLKTHSHSRSHSSD